MANSFANQPGGDSLITQGPSVRAWVFGLLGVLGFMAVAGLVLAALVPETARPYAGVAYVLAMGLAIVVGASKTSSA